MRHWCRALAVFSALSLLAACGSTVHERGQAAKDGPGSDTVEEAGSEFAPTRSGTTEPTPGLSVTTGVRRRTAGTRTDGAASPNRSTAPGPGVTNDKIAIGLPYTVNSSAATAALGASGITVGDLKRENQIVIDDINAHGGVAGRALDPVWHEVDGASTASYDTVAQEACDDWTQDHEVFAAFAGGNETLQQCLHNRGVVAVQDDLTNADGAVFRRFPYYVEIDGLNLDRMAAAEVDALAAQRWLSGWDYMSGRAASTKAKVGIVTYDSATWDHALDASLVPALRKLGYAPASEDVIRVAPPEQTSDEGPIGAAVSSAVLKLRSHHVSHVIIFDGNGLLTLFFMRSADSQGYWPRYGLNTQNSAQLLLDGAALPARQLVGARGIGWLPGIDIPPSRNTRNGPYSNEPRRKCLALFESKGVTFADANAEAVGMLICGELWFFRDAVTAAGGAVNRDAFMSGVAKLGSSFVSAVTFGNRFSATQHDGIAAYRHYAYDEGCRCMAYTGGNIAV